MMKPIFLWVAGVPIVGIVLLKVSPGLIPSFKRLDSSAAQATGNRASREGRPLLS